MRKLLFAFAFLFMIPLISAQVTPDPDSGSNVNQRQIIEEGKRFLYFGYVEIEPMTFEEITKGLEDAGCEPLFYEQDVAYDTSMNTSTEAGESKIQDGCVYVDEESRTTQGSQGNGSAPASEDTIEESTEIDEVVKRAIAVYPKGAAYFGPTGFGVTGTRLYARHDIEGPQDEKKFRDAVKADVAAVGSFINLKEDSWVLVEVIDSSDIVYAAGDPEGSAQNLFSLISKAESRTPFNPLLIAAAVIVIAAGVLIYKKFA